MDLYRKYTSFAELLEVSRIEINLRVIHSFRGNKIVFKERAGDRAKTKHKIPKPKPQKPKEKKPSKTSIAVGESQASL